MNYITAIRIVRGLFEAGQEAMDLLDRAQREGRDVTDDELAELDKQADNKLAELKRASK